MTKNIPTRVLSTSITDRILHLEAKDRTFDSSVYAPNADLYVDLPLEVVIGKDDEGSSSSLATPKKQKGLYFAPILGLLSKILLVWCLIVVFVVSGVSKPKRTSRKADFLSRQRARLSSSPLRIAHTS